MDGRLATGLLTLLLPAILIGVTYAVFNSNPLAILALFSVMVLGCFYLISYRESF
ncbi:MAG TPA: hypothetical protein VGU43_04740 [Thermoplasmata archaeon]|nr:hypothetical protein [Thermoplasmata archaeon]